MPQVVVGAALSGVLAATAVGATIGTIATAFAGSLILGGLSYALTPKPKKANVAASDNTVSIRQSDLSRQLVYGHTRVTRGYAHMQSTGSNGKLHNILLLCEGPLRAINEIWLNDYAIPNDWIDAEGNVTQGRYAGKLVIRKHLGSFSQTADPLAVQNMEPWTVDHRLQGIAYLYIIMTKDQDAFPSGLPNISAIVEGPALFDPRTGTSTWSTNIALMAADFIRKPDYGLGAFEDDIDDDNTAAQANICDEMVTVPAEDYSVTAVDTGNDRLALSGSILSLQFGDMVQVNSTGTLPGGLTAATDYYAIPYQVKDRPRILLASSLANAMAKVPVNITSAGSGNIKVTRIAEPRYHGGGVVDTEIDPTDTLNGIVTSMAGRAICIAGFWTLQAGAWRSPSISLSNADIRGSGYGVKNCLSMSESYNSVNGLYISQDQQYQKTNYPPARYEQFIAEDNGLEAPKQLDLGFCTRRLTAQRIAKIELFRGRQDISYQSDFSLTAMQTQPGDVTDLTLEEMGWSGKYFEVTEFKFDVNNGSLVTSLGLRETAPEIFDWSSGEAVNYDPAPNTELPNPFVVQIPTGVSYSSSYVETLDGDAIYTLTLKWQPHPNAFVTQFGDFEIQYKESTADDWKPSFLVTGDQTQSDVTNSMLNIPYDLQIRARNNLGARSAWVIIAGAVVGSSGGIAYTLDFGYVTDPPESYLLDYGSVADAPTSTEDWGFVS